MLSERATVVRSRSSKKKLVGAYRSASASSRPCCFGARAFVSPAGVVAWAFALDAGLLADAIGVVEVLTQAFGSVRSPGRRRGNGMVGRGPGGNHPPSVPERTGTRRHHTGHDPALNTSPRSFLKIDA